MTVKTILRSTDNVSLFNTFITTCLEFVGVVRSMDLAILTYLSNGIAVPKDKFVASALNVKALETLLKEISAIETKAMAVDTAFTAIVNTLNEALTGTRELNIPKLERTIPRVRNVSTSIPTWLDDLEDTENIDQYEGQQAIKRVAKIEASCWSSLHKMNIAMVSLGLDTTKDPFKKLPESPGEL
jgi:hypothetical protein